MDKSASSSNPTIWDAAGKDKYYDHYRLDDAESSKILRKWVDEAYYDNNLAQYLDKDFVKTLSSAIV